jgi:GT2 family glycosyltransferase/glycosyltransferase involved in cell wall biosynthesis
MQLYRFRGILGLVLRPYRITGKRLALLLPNRPSPHSTTLHLPSFDQILVSIIVPVFNHWSDTLACLESIVHFTDGQAYEVIVSDDSSTDRTPEMIKRIEGVVCSRNDRNLGFIGSCNRAARLARGKFLVFLNNDTIVTPGWLEALLQTFRDIPEAGLAGAKLIYPDGRLQEAGGVIFRDASGWNYGKFDDADHPRYNFAREVDYCSGACVMVPRALFERLGGFDSSYTPAYYEDADLAFKIREAGHKVVYQPLARIIHREGLTAGRSVTTGAKSYQVVNQVKFRRRWSDRLAAHPEPALAKTRIVHPHGVETARGKVLVIDHRVPSPDRDCGSVRMLEMLSAIRRRGHHVSFVPDNMIASSPYRQLLQRAGVEVIHHPYYHSVAAFLKRHGQEFDLAIISRAEVAARHMTTVKRYAPSAKIVFDTVDLHYLREEREAGVKQDPSLKKAVSKRKQQELRLARQSDLTMVVSPVEKAILARECPGIDVRVVSTIYPLPERDCPGLEDRRNIIFIGGFEHPPNCDAVLYFAREIFPRVRALVPDAVFQVIGPLPPPEIRRLCSPSFEILGHVPDVRPCFDRARISVAPLRFGAGVKGKVNQSMSLGVPAVVTSIAAEGMYLVHEENAMIADEPESFAEAIERVWTSPDLWKRLSAGGRKNVREHFSVEVATRRIDELLEWAGLPVSDGSH